MIKIEYDNTAVTGIGNRMFVYAFSRHLAEKNGLALECDPLYPGFDYARPISGKRYPISQPRCTDMNSKSVFNESIRRGVVVKGYFQRYEYVRDIKNRVKVWFRLPEVNLDADTVVAHVRNWDYVGTDSHLALKFYRESLARMRWKRLIVIGVGIDEATKKWFAEYSPEYPDGNPADDMALMYSANKLIMSNSTFAWWGAWLSRAKTICYPVPPTGYFSDKVLHQNLRVPEDRYHYFNAEIQA